MLGRSWRWICAAGPVRRVSLIESVAAIEEGGRLWWSEGFWTPFVGRVFDLCDDHEAAVVAGYSPSGSPAEEIDYDAPVILEGVRLLRERGGIVCNEAEAATPNYECWSTDASRAVLITERPPASLAPSEVEAWAMSEGLRCENVSSERRRYVYIAADGPLAARASAAAALDAYREILAEASTRNGTRRPPGQPLGYRGNTLDEFVPQAEPSADAMVVLAATVSVIDGVVRGLAQNLSETLWARNATVIATDPSGGEHRWRFPLAVQPGELMPFEIEGWPGPQDSVGDRPHGVGGSVADDRSDAGSEARRDAVRECHRELRVGRLRGTTGRRNPQSPRVRRDIGRHLSSGSVCAPEARTGRS